MNSELKAHSVRWSIIAVITSMLFLSSWAVASPVASSPDDDYHLSSIWCGQGIREGLCEIGDLSNLGFKVPYSAATNSWCFAFQSNLSGNCPYSNELFETPRVNFSNVLYPPVYYWTMSWFVNEDVSSSVIITRILNSLLAVSLLSLIIYLLPAYLRRIPVIAVVTSSIPLGVFLLASNNPSAWAYTGVLSFFCSVLGYFASKERKSRYLFVALSVFSFVVSAGSRGDAALFSVFAMFLVMVLMLQKSDLTASKIVFFAIFSILGILSYLNSGAPGATTDKMRESTDDDSPLNLFSNLVRLPDLWAGVFGTWGLGWLDTLMPPIVWVSTLCLFFALLFTSIQFFTFRQKIAFLFVALALVFVPLYVLSVNRLEVGQGVQPRYLLPLLALLVAVAVFRTSPNKGLNLSKLQVFIMGITLIVAHSVALNTNLRRYISGIDIRSFNLDNTVEWWWDNAPVSPSLVWLAGSVFFGIFLISLWKLRRELGLPAVHDDNTVRKPRPL